MEIIFKHVWVGFIVIAVINAFLLKKRTTKYSDINPELEEGYDNYIKGYVIFFGLPWLIIGLGILLGSINNIFEVFKPRLMMTNPTVLGFHAWIVLSWILGIY